MLFDSLEDIQKAQELSNTLSMEKLHRRLEVFAGRFCPVYKELRYYWSVMQAEYATNLVFKNQEDLQRIYSELVATAIHTVKPKNIATFLGRKLDPRYQGGIGDNYNIRIEGSRVKHSIGSCSIKMYDKFSKILRIETTANDISLIKHLLNTRQKKSINIRDKVLTQKPHKGGQRNFLLIGLNYSIG